MSLLLGLYILFFQIQICRNFTSQRQTRRTRVEIGNSYRWSTSSPSNFAFHVEKDSKHIHFSHSMRRFNFKPTSFENIKELFNNVYLQATPGERSQGETFGHKYKDPSHGNCSKIQQSHYSEFDRIELKLYTQFFNFWTRMSRTFGGAVSVSDMHEALKSKIHLDRYICLLNVHHKSSRDGRMGVLSKNCRLTMSRFLRGLDGYDDYQLRIFTQKYCYPSIQIKSNEVKNTLQQFDQIYLKTCSRGLRVFRFFCDFFFDDYILQFNIVDHFKIGGTVDVKYKVDSIESSPPLIVCTDVPLPGKVFTPLPGMDENTYEAENSFFGSKPVNVRNKYTWMNEMDGNSQISNYKYQTSDSGSFFAANATDGSLLFTSEESWFKVYENVISLILGLAIRHELKENGVSMQGRVKLNHDMSTTIENSMEHRIHNYLALYADTFGNFPKNFTEIVPSVGNVSIMFPSFSLPTFFFLSEDNMGREGRPKNMTAQSEYKNRIISRTGGESAFAPPTMPYEYSFEEDVSKKLKPISTLNRPTQEIMDPFVAKMAVNGEFAIKLGRSEELQSRPNIYYHFPTWADYSFLYQSKIQAATRAAKSIHSANDAQDFMKHVGLASLHSALVAPLVEVSLDVKINGMNGLNELIKFDNNIADEVSMNAEMIDVLIDAIEAPFKGFNVFKSSGVREMEFNMQKVSLVLIQRLIRSSDVAVSKLIVKDRLKKALHRTMSSGEICDVSSDSEEFEILVEKLLNRSPESTLRQSGNLNRTDIRASSKKVLQQKLIAKDRIFRKDQIMDFKGLKLSQMARISLMGLGGIPWEPRMPNQKGIRILSFDGGGTKGVLSLAILDEILKRCGRSAPHEMFDIICGTSTGGIIANLLGIKRQKIADAIHLYDALIDKIFVRPSRLRLVSEQATYDAGDWEEVLNALCGEELLLDSNRHDCTRTFCVSTKLNINPPSPKIWRNYNYPAGQTPRYPGAFRVKTKTAIRASTAAPTFFTPVQWNDGLYCDGALVANNPSGIAIQEAKALFPDVPIDFVLSIGTGTFIKSSNVQSMDWGLLLNQIIASSTATEDVHTILGDLLPSDQYYRFNPLLVDSFAIDEMDPKLLKNLKRVAKEWIDDMERTDPVRMKRLIEALSGCEYS